MDSPSAGLRRRHSWLLLLDAVDRVGALLPVGACGGAYRLGKEAADTADPNHHRRACGSLACRWLSFLGDRLGDRVACGLSGQHEEVPLCAAR